MGARRRERPPWFPPRVWQGSGKGLARVCQGSGKGLAEHPDFPELKGLGRIGATREIQRRLQSETRWFALSWLPAPEVLLTTVRAHRAIGNALHWQPDVTFREDAARNRKDNGPA